MTAARFVVRGAALVFAMLAVGNTELVGQPGRSETREVLLIGNDAYVDPKLNGIGTANVVRDLELLSTSFRKVAFQVNVARNLKAQEIRSHLDAFSLRARDVDVALIYFTGFGLQVADTDYMAGVDAVVPDARPGSLTDMGYVPLGAAAIAIQPTKNFSMVLAESGRIDPWPSSARGLVPVNRNVEEIAKDSDVLIFYGSKGGYGSLDGPPGGNAPFAAAVAKRMQEPGIEVGLFARRVRADVIRTTRGQQTPHFYGELGEREFYFSGAPKVQAPASLVVTNQPRLALVIGNSDYNQDGDVDDDRASLAVRDQGFASDLPNAANDVRDMAAALERLRFQVDVIENADYQSLLAALFAFEEKVLKAGEDAIITMFYAGHAIQVGGANFLIPVGAKLPPVDLDRLTGAQAELALTQYALPLQTALLGRLRSPSKRGLNLVFLDACRENPWERRSVGRNVSGRSAGTGARSRGLGEVRIDLRRTAVAFATKPGDVADDGDGRNSPYTSALKAVIEEPGLSVVELLNRVHEKVENDTSGRQVPWTNSPALGRTCLGACADVQ